LLGDNHSREETTSSRLDLLDNLLLEVDREWFTDRSRYGLEGWWTAGYTVVSDEEVIESEPFPPQPFFLPQLQPKSTGSVFVLSLDLRKGQNT
jgi:hypothetical protein